MAAAIDLSVRTIEALAVVTIVWTVLHATVRYLLNLQMARQDATSVSASTSGKACCWGSNCS